MRVPVSQREIDRRMAGVTMNETAVAARTSVNTVRNFERLGPESVCKLLTRSRLLELYAGYAARGHARAA